VLRTSKWYAETLCGNQRFSPVIISPRLIASSLSRRGYIERNSIALLSKYNKPPLDPPAEAWLGRHCNRERVRQSGLWNSNHVDENYDPAFLDELDRLVLGIVRAS
jgi:hypothetical protein